MVEKNGTLSLVIKTKNKHAIWVKWIFRTKHNPDGSINKYKGKLVVTGYAQQTGVDYEGTFAPMEKNRDH